MMPPPQTKKGAGKGTAKARPQAKKGAGKKTAKAPPDRGAKLRIWVSHQERILKFLKKNPEGNIQKFLKGQQTLLSYLAQDPEMRALVRPANVLSDTLKVIRDMIDVPVRYTR